MHQVLHTLIGDNSASMYMSKHEDLNKAVTAMLYNNTANRTELIPVVNGI